MIASTANKFVFQFIVLLHWFITRATALFLVVYLAWNLPKYFNAITQPLEHFFRWLLKALEVPELVRLAIIDKQPEYIVMFILILALMYWLFSWILWPVRSGILKRTSRMIMLQITAFIVLYALAWFHPEIFGWFFDHALAIGDYVRDQMNRLGNSLDVERAKVVVNAVKPYSIIALIMMAVVVKGAYELFKFPYRLLRGGDKEEAA